MTYYPVPDIPEELSPTERRAWELTRTALQRIDAYGQPETVHQPYFVSPESYSPPDVFLSEFPVYVADRPVELVHATWTPELSGNVQHNFRLRWGPGSTPTERLELFNIIATSVQTTPWEAFKAKEFNQVTKGRRLLPGHILTLEILGVIEGIDHGPYGLFSMFFRGAVS